MSASESVTVDSDAYWPADVDAEEAIVTNWFVQPGTQVQDGDLLGEIQVEKVAIELTATTTGEVTALLVDEDAAFEQGEPLLSIAPRADE
jgi:biotin carboxyl carrier protein